jgi:predicted Na+-dependent transporter
MKDSMKSKIAILFFAFCIVSLIIAVFQFVKGETFETILSIIYSSVFFIGGMMYKSKNGKG